MNKSIKTFIIYFILTIAACIALFPIIWIFLTALKNRVQTFAMPPIWVFVPNFKNFIELLNRYAYGRYFFNSVIVVIAVGVISIFAGTLAAYGFTRFKIKKGNFLLFWILSIRMMPPVAGILPMYIIISKLGLLDTRIALIIANLLFNLPLVVWLMRGFLIELPGELEEAAMIDGCSRLGAFLRISLPLCLPGIVATATFVVIFTWNEFMYALTLTGIKSKTMPVAIMQFVTNRGIDWNKMAAAGTLSIFPIIIFTLLISKYLIRGLSLGALKE